MLVCVLYTLLHARLRVQRAPGFPCALCCRGAERKGQTSRETSGEIADSHRKGCLRIESSCVVPAKAGTHTPRLLVRVCGQLSFYNKRRWLMVWTAPYGISCARMRLLEISDKGAVREPDYPNWNGYVEVYFSTAWG